MNIDALKVVATGKDSNTHTISIDTRFRDNYYTTESSDFSITLPTKIHQVTGMSITDIMIPVSFYAISEKNQNNYFFINDTKVEIPSGTYTPTNFVTRLNNLLATSADANLNTIESAIDEASGKIIIARHSGGATFTMSFNRDILGNVNETRNIQLNLGWLMGYRFAHYQGSSAYVSEGLYETNSPRYIYISVDEFTNNQDIFFTAALNDSILRHDILAKAPVDVAGPGNFLTSANFSFYTAKLRTFSGSSDINRLRIRLFDEYGRTLDMNNMDYSLTIDFTVIASSSVR